MEGENEMTYDSLKFWCPDKYIEKVTEYIDDTINDILQCPYNIKKSTSDWYWLNIRHKEWINKQLINIASIQIKSFIDGLIAAKDK